MRMVRAVVAKLQRALGGEPSVTAVVVGAVTLLVVGIVCAVYQVLTIYSNAADGLSDVGEVLAHEVAASLVEHDADSANRALRLVSAHPNISSAAVYTADGTLFAHYPSTETRPAVRRDARDGTHFENGTLILNRPVHVGDHTIGAIYLRVKSQIYYHRLIEHLLIAVIAIAVSLLMLLLSRRLQRHFAHTETKLRQAEATAEKATQIQSNLVANMTHEIRTPMNAVIGMTDLLANTRLTNKQQNYIQTIRRSGELLLSVVDNKLDLFKLEADKLYLERVEFDVEDVVESALEMLGYKAYGKNVELACRYEKTAGLRLRGDPNRLRQILVNLLSNAVKFTEAGEVVVDCSLVSETDDQVRLRFAVSDTGIGIAPEFLDHVFDMFSQSNATLQYSQGTGLGLAICKKLVEMLGGEIHAESEHGAGSNFWFEVPLAKLPCSHRDESQPRSASDRRALVVDDNHVVGQALCEYASAWGMRVDYEADANAALDRLIAAAADDRYDVAIIDVNMPAMDGITLARRMQRESAIASTRKVLMASVVQPIQPGVVSSLRRTRCINKPILPRALRDAVLELFDDDGTLYHIRSSVRSSPVSSGIDTRARVLVAEDNPASQLMLLDMLATLGLSADSVADGASVIDAMQHNPYDLILLDCQMPKMDGYEVTAKLRQQYTDALKPVIIAVSAFASNEHIQRCLQLGMNDYIAKPVRLQGLQKMLATWIPSKDAALAPESSALEGAVWHDWRQYQNKDPSIFAKLTETFVDDANQRLAAISETLDSGNATELARTVHALRSGCLQLGATRMAASCLAIEQAAQRGTTDIAPRLLQRLRDEFRLLKQELEDTAGAPLEKTGRAGH